MEFYTNKSVMVLQMGGTIDKDYPQKVGNSAAVNILKEKNPSYTVDCMSICRKDSQDVSEYERGQLLLNIRRTHQHRILVTHGTDTMIETARYLGPRIEDKLVIMTGSKLPHTFKDSDADFNVGLAVGALQFSEIPGVYVAMNGAVHLWSEVSMDPNTGRFMGKL